MPKYKKCPRCDLNYILEEEEYCKICQEELRGISHNTEDLDEEIEEDGILCPRCHVNYLNDGETICEACAAEEDEKHTAMDDIEPDWDETDEADALDEDADLATDDEIDLSLEELQDEEEEDLDEEYEEEGGT